jgi:Glycosyl transferases group 1
MSGVPIDPTSRHTRDHAKALSVLFDARLAVRGLGIASATKRLLSAMGDDPDIHLSVNTSSRGWTRAGQIETILRSGLLDISPKLDPRAWTNDVVHYFGNTAPQFMNDSSLVTIYDLMSLKGTSRKSRLYVKLLMPGLKRSQRGVLVTISQQTADDVVAAIPHLTGRLNVIPLGKRPGLFSNQDREHILMFGGGQDPRKRTGLGLEGYMSYRQRNGAAALPLIVAGRAGLDPTLDLESLHDHSVSIESNPSDARVVELLAKAAAVVYPTREEGYGLPILEAGEVGTPVVLDLEARIPSEPMGDHVFGVRGTDPSDWGRAIHDAVKGGPVADAIPTVPTWADTAEQYKQLYRSMASRG